MMLMVLRTSALYIVFSTCVTFRLISELSAHNHVHLFLQAGCSFSSFPSFEQLAAHCSLLIEIWLLVAVLKWLKLDGHGWRLSDCCRKVYWVQVLPQCGRRTRARCRPPSEIPAFSLQCHFHFRIWGLPVCNCLEIRDTVCNCFSPIILIFSPSCRIATVGPRFVKNLVPCQEG